MTKRAYPPQNSGKDEETMLEQITMTLVHVGAFLAVAAACVGGYLIYQENKRRNEEAEKAQRAKIAEEKRREKEQREKAQREKEREQKKELIEAYCQKAREIDGYRDQDAYRDCFMGIAPFLQLLLGAQRRFQLEGEASVEILRTALKMAAQNANLDRKLTAEGFKVAQVPSEYNEEALRASCEKVSNKVLQEEAEELDWKLRDCQRSLNYKEITRDIEPILYGIVQDIQSGDIERCVQCVPQLKGVLEEHNCHAIYWNDDRVKESETLRASFQEDGPYATELPGFFTRIDGRYDRLGTLGGTMREV